MIRPRAHRVSARALLAAAAAAGCVAGLAAPARGQEARIELPLSELQRLAAPAQRPAAELAPLVPHRAHYALTVARDHVRLRGELLVDSPTAGQRLVLILPAASQLVPTAVLLGGEPVPLVQGAAGVLAVLPAAGRHRIVVELVLRTTAGVELAGPVSVDTLLPPAVVTTLDVEAPSFVRELAVDAAPRVAEDGHKLALPAPARLTASWVVSDVADDLADHDATTPETTVLDGQATQLLTAGEGRLRLEAVIELTVTGAPVEAVTARVPPGLDLVACDGPEVARCQPEADGALRVTFRYPITGAHALRFELERPLTTDAVGLDYPRVQLDGLASDQGVLAVQTLDGTEVLGEPTGKARRADASEVPAALQERSARPILLAFQYSHMDSGVKLRIQQHASEPVLAATIDRADVLTLITGEGKAVTRATWSLRNSGKPFLRLAIPEGATLLGAFVDGAAQRPRRDAETGELLVPLTRSRQEGGALLPVRCEVVYLWGLPEGPLLGSGVLSVPLPSVDIPISALTVSLYLPPRLYFEPEGLAFETVGQEATTWASVGDVRRRVGEKGELGESVPVDFEIPRQGTLITMRKNIILEKERDSIKLLVTSRRVLDMLELVLMGLVACAVAASGATALRWLLRERDRATWLTASAAGLAGVLAVAAAVVWPLAEWPWFLGAFVGMLGGGAYVITRIVRYLLSRAADRPTSAPDAAHR